MSENDFDVPPKSSLKELLKHYEEGRFIEAKKLSISITKQFPKHQFSWKVLGAVLHQTGSVNEGIVANQKAVNIDPKDADAYNNLGAGFQEVGNFEEAELSYRQAIILKTNFYEAYTNLGVVLQEMSNLDEAEKNHRKAIALNSNYVFAHINLGVTLKELGKFEEAIESYNKAIKLNPNYSTAYTNKNFCLNYSSKWSPMFVYQQHLEFGKQFENSKDCNFFYKNKKNIFKERLRVGYVSGDFRGHSVAHFFLPLLECHNSNKVEIYCYYNNKRVDDFTNRIRQYSDHWRFIFGVSDTDVLNIIKNDDIDILVDLSGHTGKNRLKLFAQKPAPIQITWLGYPNTTGLSTIDYRFTDIIADPIGEADKIHSEKLFRLPNGFQCYKGNPSVTIKANIPQIENSYITFGSFNNLLKVTPEVIKVWSKILKLTPGSRLILKGAKINQYASQYLDLFAKEGVPKENIIFYGKLHKIKEHLELYNSIDIALDPFPYNGATTTCEALWMGVPVITLLGDRHVGRVGASILSNVGLKSFIAADINIYIELAIELAQDVDRLQIMRKDLRKKMQKSLLCNASSFAKDIENAFQEIWSKH